MTETIATAPALTRLAEDEAIFRDSVYEFADKEVRPLAREMDEHAKMSPALLEKLFAMGLLSVEVPDTYGGAGGTFFHSVLAVESLSRVDPSVGVLVDVQNTLVINAVMRWGSDALKKTYLTKLAASTIGAYCLSEAGSGSDAFALTTRAVVGIVKHQFHTGAAGGLARGGAVKDHILHGLAAQFAGAALAQNPAYRVHDVGLTATVRADHTD